MSLLEIAAAIGGLAIGYWLVNVFLSSPKLPPDGSAAPEGDPPVEDVPPRHWTEVLGVPPAASEQDITAAWRRAVAQYHPDRVATMAAEIQTLAQRRTAEINAAYDEAMRSGRRSGSRFF